MLIIGGSGLVGSTLTNYAHSQYNVHLTKNTNEIELEGIPTTTLDLLEGTDVVVNLIKNFRPDTVVHTAAFPSVDYCETNPQMANLLHVKVTNDIAKVCKETNSKLFYISTDAVFDGTFERKYTEDDIPNPISHYGKTKLKAEQIILNASKENVILRTTVIYGNNKKSRFTNWVLGLLKQKKVVEAFTDQHNTPTLVDDLAKSILKINEMRINGLYNAVGQTCVSRYEFALLLADRFGFDKKLIKPVTSLQKKQDALRPVNGCLDNKKLEEAIGYNFCSLEEGIDFIVKSSQIE